MSQAIFHLAESADWELATTTYSPASLADEGFIHCSTRSQIDTVAREIFSGRNDMVLLAIDPDLLTKEPVFEDLYDKGEQFPHVYETLPVEAVTSARPYLKHLEEDLWTRETRFDLKWMERVLHPRFDEFGASGKHHTRSDTLEVADQPILARFPLIGYRLDLLSPDVAMARYVTQITYDKVVERARRSSIWVRTDDGWQLRFHQGTPIPEPLKRQE